MYIATAYLTNEEKSFVFKDFNQAKAWLKDTINAFYFNEKMDNDREYEGRYDIYLLDDNKEIISYSVGEIRPCEMWEED